MSEKDKLVSMANQIGKFYAREPADRAVSEIAAHIRKFWEPRMRHAIFAKLNEGGEGLDPNPRAAVESLHRAEVNQQA